MTRDRLAAEGIAAEVRDHLSGGRGELPIPDSWPTVWVVAADADAARALILLEETLRLVTKPWICPGCGEPNDGSFDWCWSCATPAT